MPADYDLVILGGGTGGLVSSLIAANIGARVALVERGRTGGDCLWTGCVPSKSLIAAAHLAHRMRHGSDVGLRPVEPDIDFAQVMAHVHGAIARIEPHDSPERLRSEGVEVIAGEGRFVDARTIAADGRRLGFRSAIVATGSEPAIPPVDGLAGDDVLTTETLWSLRELPRRLVVLGGGPIGCELGQAFARLGAEVTMIEVAERLLLKEEPGAGALIAQRLQAEGVDVRLGTRALELRRPPEAPAQLVVESALGTGVVEFDRIVVAAGRRPRTAGIGLEAAGVETGPGAAITVDGRLRTSAPRIFAVGDVTGLLPFTHVAAHHARVATLNALFGMRRTVDDTIPWVTFTDPEVAHVGLTEEQARARWGAKATVAHSRYEAVDRAVTEGDTEGFVLLVGDRRGRLVGATVVGAAAGEVIAELAARVAHGDKIDALSTTVHAYPTLAEAPARAADDYLRLRYANPRYRAAARPLLAARRALTRR
jgi:pyruvate/2-oxoglutarate dehydrogenase complex dihydrolipoamide dehydrogenase (E3) component